VTDGGDRDGEAADDRLVPGAGRHRDRRDRRPDDRQGHR
jgi:hypothetical protein